MKTIQEIKDDFRDRKEFLIIVNNGDTFIGSIEQLQDCFGVDINQLPAWCDFYNMKYEVINND